MTNDMVNHPPHYQHPSGIECIEIIEQIDCPLIANAFKYVFRAGKKEGKFDEDLEKALWYIGRKIDICENFCLMDGYSLTLGSLFMEYLAHEADTTRSLALIRILRFYVTDDIEEGQEAFAFIQEMQSGEVN